ncbi:MAG: Gfo/Idh/MocA family oxidoreductase [Thermoguttaceae bacterium]|nr:Gfo/Idh/MocA family oxidoreductase [Thermoguttaceae bacterium]
MRQTRRDFLKASAAAVAAAVFPVPAFSRDRSPSEKLNIAQVGVGGMQWGFHSSHIVNENPFAFSDVDANILAAAKEKFPNVQAFADWRDMLDQLGDQIDGVLISTTDHSHAVIAMAAMRRGIHCYCEKPLAHDVWQIRQMQKIAREKGLKTQMGTQIHAGDNYRRVVEKIQAGMIGEIKEIHVRVGVVWGGSPATAEQVECPKNINWDLWIGPAPMRPYQPCYFGGNWRSFWDFGNGGMGDMACHWIDLPFWALGLAYPKSIEASAPKPADPDFAARDLTVRFEFDYNGRTLPLTWYDGTANSDLFAQNQCPDGSVTLFIGSEGPLWSTYGDHALVPADKFAEKAVPEPSIPSSIGHHEEWFDAIRNDHSTTCNFDYSGRLAETVLLGPVAYRCGKKLFYNADTMSAPNAPEADKFLRQPMREGWEI